MSGYCFATPCTAETTNSKRKHVSVRSMEIVAAKGNGAGNIEARENTPDISIPTSRLKGVFQHKFHGDNSVKSLAIGADNRYMLMGESNTTYKSVAFSGYYTNKREVAFARLWDLSTGREIRRFPAGKHMWINSVTLSADGSWAAGVAMSRSETIAVHTSREVFLWNTKTGEEFLHAGNDSARELRRNAGVGKQGATVPGKVYVNCEQVAFTKDGKYLVGCGNAGPAVVWSMDVLLKTGDTKPLWQAGKTISSQPISSNDSRSVFLFGTSDGRSIGLQEYNLATRKVVRHHRSAHGGRVSHLTISPSQAVFAEATKNQIDVRDMQTGRIIRSLKKQKRVGRPEFLSSDELLVPIDRELILWNVKDDTRFTIEELPSGSRYPIAVSPTGTVGAISQVEGSGDNASHRIELVHFPSMKKLISMYPRFENREHHREIADEVGLDIHANDKKLPKLLAPYLSTQTKQKVPVSREDDRGRLFLLAIGVSKHRYSEYNLGYAAADSNAIVDFFSETKSDLFREVFVQALTDEQATANNIKASIDWIAAACSEKDVCIVFFAGHGLKGMKGLYFVCHEGDPQIMQHTCMNWGKLGKSLASVKAKQTLVLLDCCHAGAFGIERTQPQDAIIKSFGNRNNIFVFAASARDTESLELEGDKHGVFTLAILNALQGAADIDGNKRITLGEIQQHVTSTVSRRTDGMQVPHLPFPNRYDSKLELVRTFD